MSEKETPKENEGPSPIGEIEQGPSSFDAFLDANQKKLMVIASLLVVAVVAYVVITGVQKKNREDAAAEVSAASATQELPALRAAYDKHKDTPAGAAALVYIAQGQWADQRQQEAIETLKTVITEYPEHPLISSVYMKLGGYHRALNQLDEAKGYFEKAADADTAVSSPALVALGNLAMRAGDHEAAKEYLARVSSDYGQRHPNFKNLSEEHAKLVGITHAVEVTPPPKEDKKAASGAVKLPELPKDPTPQIPQIPKVPTPGLPGQ